MKKSTNNLRTAIYKPVAAQYFFVGVIVGIIVGVFLLSPMESIQTNMPYFRYTNRSTKITLDEEPSEALENETTERPLTEQIADDVKIMCLILTSPTNHKIKAPHVKATWGKRCTYLLFMSTVEDPSLPAVPLPVKEGRENLWGKTKESFKYAHEHFFDKADWFFKADDDTYTIMENMRSMLRNENSSKPIYFGCRFKPFTKQGYMSGGAGYVLSKEALRRFIYEGLPDPAKCKPLNKGNEDVEMGKCMEAVGVEARDTRDLGGKYRFLPIMPNGLLKADMNKDHWLFSYAYYPLGEGEECCSSDIISMHYVDPGTMYLLEYLIYHVKTNNRITYNSSDIRTTRPRNQTNQKIIL